MKLLLVNDDGIQAKGLHALAKELEKNNDITIVAPQVQKSACGHSITIARPLIVKREKLEGIKSEAFSVGGTPADCVRIALDKLIDGKVDMILSGINRGINVGVDVLYSGTVSAAIEAAIYKIPSMAVSVEISEDVENYEAAARYASKVLSMAAKNNIKDDIVLNLNIPIIPENEIKGIKVCKIGGKVYNNYFIEESNENENVSFMLKGDIVSHESTDTDTYYLKNGYVTLTPLHYDLTNFKILGEVEKWL